MASSSLKLPSLPSLGSTTGNGTFGFSATGAKSQFGFKPFKQPKAPSGPTAQQALMAVYLHNQQHPHHSLLGRLFHSGAHVVEKGLDYLGRPAAAIAGGVYHATEGKGFNWDKLLSGAEKGITGKEHIGFGQVLKEHHILDGHGTLRGIAGFGLDVTTDPVLLASLGTGAGEAEIAAKEAEMGLAKGTLKKAVDKTLTGSFKSSQEAVAAHDLLKGAGKGFEARAALANAHRWEVALKEKGLYDTKFGEAAQTRLHALQGAADAEHLFAGPRMLRAQYRIPFTTTLSKELPIKAPSLLRVANSQGLLGHVPGLPNAAETIGKAFKPGWRNEKMHALEQIALKVSEHRHDQMLKMVSERLGKYAGKQSPLSQDEMLHALHFGETTPGIVKMRPDRATRTLSKAILNKAVKEGKLSQEQANFIRAWHQTTESLAKSDRAFGVKYDQQLLKGANENVLYVPHVRDVEGNKITSAGSVLAKKGFQFARSGGSQASIMQELAHNPETAKDVITNPLHLMLRRVGAGATKQAEQLMTDTVASTFGVPVKLADQAKQLFHLGKVNDLHEKLWNLHTLDPAENAALHHEAALKTELERQTSLQKAGEKHALREQAIKKNIKNLQARIRRANTKKVPTAAQFLTMRNEKADALAKALAKRGQRGFAAGITQARAKSKAIDALERQIVKSEQRSGALQAVTGTKPHGSNYKGLIQDLLSAAKPALPKATHEAIKAGAEAPFKRGETWLKRHDRLVEDLLNEVKNQRRLNKEALDTHLAKHIPSAGKGRSNLEAQLAVQKQTLERHRAAWEPIQQKIDQRAATRLQRRVDDLQELQAKELDRGTAIAKAIERHRNAIEYHATSLDNPAAHAPGLKIVPRVKAPNGKPMALPKEMADALERQRQALSSDEFLNKFHNTWQKLVSQWKVGVTVVNPGYRVRNTLSDLWNAYISPHGGVPIWAMNVYGTKAARLTKDIVAAGKKDPAQWTAREKDAMRTFIEAYHHGILSGLFQGDVEKVRRYLEGTGSAKELVKGGHPLQAVTKVATDFNRHAENWGRLMHYLYRREYQKMGAGQAARIVREAHFDYEDLTPTEQALKRSLVPFYTWTRKNIPYQISSMVQRPGKYAAFPLLTRESEFASGNNKGQIEPSFLKQSLAFHVPFGGKGNFYMPVFGPVDLEKLQHPISQGAGMLSPLIQIPTELLTNKSLNTGAPIYGNELTHPRTPISGLAASILSNIPGTNVGQTERQVGGKRISGPGANPLVSYFASQTPLSNLLVNSESNIRKAQRGGGNKALLSEFGGLSTYKPDQQQMQAAAQFQAQQGFKQYIRGLRDMGVIPEAKKPTKSAAAKRNARQANIAFGG